MPVFSLDPVQIAWCAELRELAAGPLRELAARGEPGRVNRPLLAELGERGLLRRMFTGPPPPPYRGRPRAGGGGRPGGGGA
ncbi:acyl-CoA dehydrogenase, partial [Streptomyces sp. NPDC058953]